MVVPCRRQAWPRSRFAHWRFSAARNAPNSRDDRSPCMRAASVANLGAAPSGRIRARPQRGLPHTCPLDPHARPSGADHRTARSRERSYEIVAGESRCAPPARLPDNFTVLVAAGRHRVPSSRSSRTCRGLKSTYREAGLSGADREIQLHSRARGRVVGKSRTTSNLLRMLRCRARQTLVKEGKLSPGNARALVVREDEKIADESFREPTVRTGAPRAEGGGLNLPIIAPGRQPRVIQDKARTALREGPVGSAVLKVEVNPSGEPARHRPLRHFEQSTTSATGSARRGSRRGSAANNHPSSRKSRRSRAYPGSTARL